MVIGCVRLTDVSVIDTICSYGSRKKVWGLASKFLYGAYIPEERLRVDSNGKNGNYTYRRECLVVNFRRSVIIAGL